MAKFEELNDNMMILLNKLLSSQELCKLIYYNSDNPLGEADIADTRTLLFNNIYPVPKIPDAEKNDKTLLTLMFENIRYTNVAFKSGNICFRVMCHNDLWILHGQQAIRPLLILNQIDKLMNGQRVIGIGKMVFDGTTPFVVNNLFSGYRVDYKIVEFN